MKSTWALALAVAAILGTTSGALAAEDKKLTPQQEKMKTCNAEAGDKKGDERKAFMSQCLRGGAMPMTQQERMKKSSTDASTKSLKGDERKAFMSECLKGEKKS